ncbi:hypothetical protein [Halorubrum vacuolatum]|uniref:Uncharacterized protein n=1 Tax=Halorubrum vacuolatum TaxID=63740 RepID=A0A238Y6F2_HALVU|nr:hypothetical protein [Halorubrum vacuolatum]SNR66381.1 hypothetical protein SAMN06264855_1314 [Halorubrum vacuolatum]
MWSKVIVFRVVDVNLRSLCVSFGLLIALLGVAATMLVPNRLLGMEY